MKTNDIPKVQYKIDLTNLENLFNVYSEKDGNFFYNLLRTVNIPVDMDATYFDYYVVKTSDVWPLISYEFYNTVNLWWVICAANQISDPSAIPTAGAVIKIIKNQYVSEILSELGN